ESLCAIIDTGFTGGVAVTDDDAKKLSLREHPAGGRVVYGGGDGETWVRPRLADLSEIHLGTLTFRNVPAAYARGGIGECGNLLGMEILSRHRVIFDLGNQRVWLLPRAAGA